MQDLTLSRQVTHQCVVDVVGVQTYHHACSTMERFVPRFAGNFGAKILKKSFLAINSRVGIINK